MSEHARLSPSACARWSTCTASVRFVEELTARRVVPADDATEWAAEGTIAHLVREMCLAEGFEPDDFVGAWMSADGFTFQVTQAMADYLFEGIQWVREQSDDLLIEKRVDLSSWLPGQFGTMDAGWFRSGTAIGRVLGLSDLKFGMNPVSAEDNEQQKLYMLGLWDALGRPDFDVGIINIDQPRAFGGGSDMPEEMQAVIEANDSEIPSVGMKFWTINQPDLIAFGDRIRNVYNDIATGRTKFAPSIKACTYCPARQARSASGYMGCPAFNQWMMDIMLGVVDFRRPFGEEMPDPRELDPAKRYEIVRNAKTFIKWLGSLHAASVEAAMSGEPDPGSKLVLGRKGSRVYTDDSKAIQIMVPVLGDEALKPMAPIGITDAQNKLKPARNRAGHPGAWERLNEIVTQAPGKPVLVPDTDAREAYVPDTHQFDDTF